MRHVKLILSSLFMLFFGAFALRAFGPLLWQEITHRNEFVIAADARVIDAKCTNINLAIAHTCTVRFAAPGSTTTRELDFGGFGRAPSGHVGLLRAQSDPQVYTADAALGEINNEMALVTVMGMVLAALPLGVVARMARR